MNRVVAEYDAPLPADGVSDGTWDLLLDRQINVTAEGDDYYQHSALKVINANGVDPRGRERKVDTGAVIYRPGNVSSLSPPRCAV